jgi:molybdopterin-guanine dinucleotide biosynthesis protein A
MIGSAGPRSDVCAAILSGGASRRMGLPKASLLLPDGRSMIETIRDGLETLCEQVVLVGQPFGLRGHQVIDDEQPDCGPLAGIEALLRCDVADRYLVVPCDMPSLEPGSLRTLLDGGPEPALHFEGHPLPCIVDSTLATETTNLLESGVRALRAWQEAVGAHTIDPRDGTFEDADTPEEFIRLWRSAKDMED